MSDCGNCGNCGNCTTVINQSSVVIPSSSTPATYNPDTGNWEWTHTPGGGTPVPSSIPAFTCVVSDGTLTQPDGCVIPSGCLAVGPDPDGNYCAIQNGAFF